jgi:hypothetical protein
MNAGPSARQTIAVAGFLAFLAFPIPAQTTAIPLSTTVVLEMNHPTEFSIDPLAEATDVVLFVRGSMQELVGVETDDYTITTDDRSYCWFALLVEDEPGGWIRVDLSSYGCELNLAGAAQAGAIPTVAAESSDHAAHLEMQLNSSGTAAVLARSFSEQAGRYQLVIRERGEYLDQLQPGDTLPIGLSFGEITEETALANGNPGVVYQLPIVADEPTTVYLDSPDFDTWLKVELPDGRSDYDDDSGSGLNSQLTFASWSSGINHRRSDRDSRWYRE